MRIVVVVLAVAIIVALDGFSAASVRDAEDRLTDSDTGLGFAPMCASAAWAREVAERVEDAAEWIEGIAAQQERAAVGTLKGAAIEEFE